MKDDEIIKALECCGNIDDPTCKECVYYETYNASCVVRLMRDALDLINRQKAELKKIKTDLKHYFDTNEENGVVYIPKCIIDNIVKEIEEVE